MNPTPVVSEIDLNADGRHAGFLRLPHSVHRSAYGFIPVPIISVKRGSGPCVVLMAGNHGDEYEGQVALAKLARHLDPDTIEGQVIILPAANTPAVCAGLRTSPLDEGNLNRSFPGNPRGTPTEIIADYLERDLFKRADYLLDLHSGGSSLVYLPTALVDRGHSAVDNRRRLDIVRALGLPWALIFDRDADGPYATSAVTRQGGLGLTVELGGGGAVTPAILSMIETGLHQYLAHLGVIKHAGDGLLDSDCHEEPTLLMIKDDTQYVYARTAGVFEPAVELGVAVRAGQLAGRIHTPETPWQASAECHFECDGIVICRRAMARSLPGDCLFQLGCHLPGDYLIIN